MSLTGPTLAFISREKVLVLAGNPMEQGARFARLGSAVQGILPYAFLLGPSFPKRAFRGGRARNEGCLNLRWMECAGCMLGHE